MTTESKLQQRLGVEKAYCINVWAKPVRRISPGQIPRVGLHELCGRITKYHSRDTANRVIRTCIDRHKETLNSKNCLRLLGRRPSQVSILFGIQSVGTRRQDSLVGLPVLEKMQPLLDCGRAFLVHCKPQHAIVLRRPSKPQLRVKMRSPYFMLPSAWNAKFRLIRHLSHSVHDEALKTRLSAPTAVMSFVKRLPIDRQMDDDCSEAGQCHPLLLRIHARNTLAQFATTLRARTNRESRTLRELLAIDPFKMNPYCL